MLRLKLLSDRATANSRTVFWQIFKLTLIQHEFTSELVYSKIYATNKVEFNYSLCISEIDPTGIAVKIVDHMYYDARQYSFQQALSLAIKEFQPFINNLAGLNFNYQYQ